MKKATDETIDRMVEKIKRIRRSAQRKCGLCGATLRGENGTQVCAPCRPNFILIGVALGDRSIECLRGRVIGDVGRKKFVGMYKFRNQPKKIGEVELPTHASQADERKR